MRRSNTTALTGASARKIPFISKWNKIIAVLSSEKEVANLVSYKIPLYYHWFHNQQILDLIVLWYERKLEICSLSCSKLS
jgi:hypothetical protein